MNLELDKTYLLRNGQRVYLYKIVFNGPPEIVIGYAEDGTHPRFERTTGASWNYFFGGFTFNEPELDIVSESIDLGDLKQELIAYEDHVVRQRAALDSFEGRPDSYELYRQWNRANRPPGPIRRGMRESDYD